MSRALQNYVVKCPAKDNMSKETKQRLIFLCRQSSPKLSRDEIRGYKEEFKSLLEEENINLDQPRFQGSSLLCEACRAGNLWAVEFLLDEGADVDVSDKNKCTPVYIAASHGFEEIVKKLVAKNANVNLQNLQGYLPLMSAVTNDHRETAKLLIEAGANVNICRPNTMGISLSLLVHVIAKKSDFELAYDLIDAGVLPQTFNKPLNVMFIALGDKLREMTKNLIYAGFNFYSEECVKWMEDSRAHHKSIEFFEFFEREIRNPPPLERLCRTVVRCSLVKSRVQCHIRYKIETLPLPVAMKKYLLLQYH